MEVYAETQRLILVRLTFVPSFTLVRISLSIFVHLIQFVFMQFTLTRRIVDCLIEYEHNVSLDALILDYCAANLVYTSY